jgi:hypothetical protein
MSGKRPRKPRRARDAADGLFPNEPADRGTTAEVVSTDNTPSITEEDLLTNLYGRAYASQLEGDERPDALLRAELFAQAYPEGAADEIRATYQTEPLSDLRAAAQMQSGVEQVSGQFDEASASKAAADAKLLQIYQQTVADYADSISEDRPDEAEILLAMDAMTNYDRSPEATRSAISDLNDIVEDIINQPTAGRSQTDAQGDANEEAGETNQPQEDAPEEQDDASDQEDTDSQQANETPAPPDETASRQTGETKTPESKDAQTKKLFRDYNDERKGFRRLNPFQSPFARYAGDRIPDSAKKFAGRAVQNTLDTATASAIGSGIIGTSLLGGKALLNFLNSEDEQAAPMSDELQAEVAKGMELLSQPMQTQSPPQMQPLPAFPQMQPMPMQQPQPAPSRVRQILDEFNRQYPMR